jgi:hypothetical protein
MTVEKRNGQTSAELRSLGLKRDDVKAAGMVYGVKLHQAAQLLIHSGLRGEVIERQRAVTGFSRTDAAQVALLKNDKEVLRKITETT